MPENSNTFVPRKELDAYTQHIQTQFNKVFQLIEEKSAPESSVGELKAQIEALAEEIEGLHKFDDYIGERANTIARYAEYTLEKADEVSVKNDEIDEAMSKVQGFMSYTGDNVNELANEAEGFKIYMKYLKENLNVAVNFAEQWAGNTKFLYEHNDHLSESINKVAQYLEYLKQGLNTNINFTEQVAENLANGVHTPVVESASVVKERMNITENLNGKIDSIIESVKKQKAEVLSEQSNFPYFKLLSESTQREFTMLESNQKQRVVEAVATSKPMNEQDFVSIWHETLNPSDPAKVLEGIVAGMPDEYKEAWDKLDESKKNAILGKTKFYNMETPYQVKYFWHSVKELNESVGLTSLNESVTSSVSTRYGGEYLKGITAGLQRLNK